MMATRTNLTDRAKRYRAQAAVTGPHRCVICGMKGTPGRGPQGLDVMHLDGFEDHGGKENLAYGCRRCNAALSAAFKRIGAGKLTKQYNPSKGEPTYEQYVWAVSNHLLGAHDEGGKIIHATPRHKRIEYARRIWQARRERGTDSRIPDWARNPAKLERCVKDVKKKGGAVSPYAVCKASIKGNPADASAKVFREFHGDAPTETVTVEQKVHRHKYLAAAGELVGLQVAPINGSKPRRIEGMGKDALLTFNETKSQLFVTGGDQYLSPSELRKFGADGGHELETLGKLTGVGYFTDKTHLGKEGGEAIYDHKFRTTNENGRHITVTIARYPDLIYRVLNQELEISGGSYTILAEGIDK